MRILITGSSGFIGGYLISALKDEYKLRTPKLNFSGLLTPGDWSQYLQNVDAVINCAGIISETKKRTFDVVHHKAPVALYQACLIAGIKRVIQISALGADETSITQYHKSKKLADDYLKSTILGWFILKPSLVYAEGGKSYAFFKKFSNLPIIPLIGKGLQMIQPVHIDVLINTIKACLHTDEMKQEIEVVGEKPLSFKSWLLKIRTKSYTPWFLPLPVNLVRLVAYLLKPLNLQFLSNDNITMLEQNNCGDYSKLRNFLENNK